MPHPTNKLATSFDSAGKRMSDMEEMRADRLIRKIGDKCPDVLALIDIYQKADTAGQKKILQQLNDPAYITKSRPPGWS